MAHGLPDWYRGVDIAYQALSQMIIRPKYGAAQVASGFTIVTASGDKTLVSVAGKGVTYGGYIWWDHDASAKADIIMLKTEGVAIAYVTPEVLGEYNFDGPEAAPAFIRRYDEVNYAYGIAIAPGITFEARFEVVFRETYGDSPEANYNIFYALI